MEKWFYKLLILLVVVVLMQTKINGQVCYAISNHSDIVTTIGEQLFSIDKLLAINTLSIEDFKTDSLIVDEIQKFFEIDELQYSKLDFSYKNEWCVDTFENVEIVDDYRNKNSMMMLSKVIFNIKEDKAFLFGLHSEYGHGFHFILFLHKNKETLNWNFSKYEIIDFFN